MPSTTHNLYISDGTETASLVTDDVYLLDYVPQTATRQAGAWQDVTESASVLIQAATTDLIRYRANVIERLLQQGEDRQSNPAQDRVFAYLQLANEDQLWRSEILGGRVEIDADGLRNWNSRSVEAVVIWTRRYYWEGEEEEIPLATADDLDTDGDLSELPTVGVDTWGVTGGVSLTNCGAGNWLETNLVNGSLPAGVRLVIEPTSQQPRYTYHVGHSVGVGGNFNHHYEAEDATGGSKLPGSADTLNYSGGYYRRVAVSATTLTSAITFTIPAADLQHADGGYFEIMGRYAGTPLAAGAMKLQARMSVEGVEVWRGPEVQTDGTCLQSFGAVQLPPGLSNVGGPLTLSLIIYARVATWSANLDVDWIQLLPVAEYRQLKPISALTGYLVDTFVVDDGLEDAVYIGRGASYDLLKLPAMIGLGERLTVTPGARNRYYVLSDQQSYLSIPIYPTQITHVVRMWHRPRRLSI